MKRAATVLALAAFIMSTLSCLYLDGSFDERELTSFSLPTSLNAGLRKSYEATIDTRGHKIFVSVPDYVDASSLVPRFEFEGIAVYVGGMPQVSGVSSQDFTKPLVYSVLGKDDKKTDYAVDVTVVPPSSAKDFSLYAIGPAYPVMRDEYNFSNVDSTSSLTGNIGYYSSANLSHLYAAFDTSGVKVSAQGHELSAVERRIYNYYPNGYAPFAESNWLDFTSPVDFVITAEDNSTAVYTARITKKPTIDSFSFYKSRNPGLAGNYSGMIDSSTSTIFVVIPNGVSLSALKASFYYTGKGVAVSGVAQTSGFTDNDFSGDVVYTVLGESGDDSTYTVRVYRDSN